MSALEEQPVNGMFGTCGESTFRDDLFIPAYKQLDIAYYNPQVAPGTWRPEMADDEADHLAHDMVQTWPVLGITYGAGSLAEQGYSIASSLRADTPFPKFIIPLIELELSDDLTDEVARNESIRARKLATSHLARNASPNVFVVDSLEEMLETSITLHGVAKSLVELSRGNNPAFKRYMEGRREREAFASAMRAGLLGNDAATLIARKDT